MAFQSSEDLPDLIGDTVSLTTQYSRKDFVKNGKFR